MDIQQALNESKHWHLAALTPSMAEGVQALIDFAQSMQWIKTAEQPPTLDDEVEGKIITFNSYAERVEVSDYWSISMNPKLYPKWKKLPQPKDE